jgi:hypothetical protein
LADRLASVQVVSGDWKRCVGDSYLGLAQHRGYTGVFFDPPYGLGHRAKTYGRYEGNGFVLAQVREWALDKVRECRSRGWVDGDGHPRLRVALCGYSDDHDEAMTEAADDGWTTLSWTGRRGWAKGENANRRTETVWLSPGCIAVEQALERPSKRPNLVTQALCA